jgi:hypothetical protein
MATKNTCSCPQPPGGTISCEPEQLAICRVKNGVAKGDCIDPPEGMDSIANLDPTEARRYYNWALQHITGQQRTPFEPISRSDEVILNRGNYRNMTTGEEVRFRLPDELNLTSPSSASSSNPGTGGAAPGSKIPSEVSSRGGATTSY